MVYSQKQQQGGELPIVIGGVGGSGTRVVAEFLINSGVYLGCDLNRSLDNLWFTYLIKRPGWRGVDLEIGKSDFASAFAVFLQAMRSPSGVSPRQLGALAAVARSHGVGSGVSRGRMPMAVWSPARVVSIIRQGGHRADALMWGWKEPNTHVFIRHVRRELGPFKYVHVMRNGFDMAYSENQQELKHWGDLFDVATESSDGRGDPTSSLDYWIRANRSALFNARSDDEIQLHVLDFDEMCGEPERVFTDLAEFVFERPLRPSPSEICIAARAVAPPPSIGRSHRLGLEPFSTSQLAAVRDLGYSAG